MGSLKSDEVYDTVEYAIGTIEASQNSLYEVNGKLVTVLPEGEALVLGDLHGDHRSLRGIMRKTNLHKRLKKDDSFTLICLGDYVDRGPAQVQVLHTLLCLLNEYPERVVLLRGNHEGPAGIRVSPHDFPQELVRRFGDEWRTLYASYRRLFDSMHVACLIEGRTLLLHGGIPTEADCLEDIARAHLTHPLTSHLEEILWSDPSTLPGVNYNFRGSGKMFGVDVASSFLDKVGVKTLIRGHECYDEGYHFHDGKILTLFSCKLPQYRNRKLAYLQMPLHLDFDRNTLQRHIFQL
jgi:protein phosphatase